MTDAGAEWWIIGSAAVALHGVDPGPIGDVDVLLGPADARRLIPTLGVETSPGRPDERFRSTIFARWTAPPLPVEFMAGLELREDGRWHAVLPRTRIALGGVFAPDRADLIAILHRFGRDKDLRRAALLA